MATKRTRISGPIATLGCALVAVVGALWGAFELANAQGSFSTGQNIAPSYEGWEQNSDGSFNLVFGYMNRNWEEEIDLPIGPDNSIEPGGPDQGQPTRFLPRRNRFLFRIRVPQDFGSKELVWTLTAHGKTERAYATLKPDYFLDDVVIMNNNGAGGPAGGSPDTVGNRAPVLKVDGERTRTAGVAQRVTLTAFASDDGKPRTRALPPSNPLQPARVTVDAATGLRLSWFVYRGAGKVTFDPPQIKVWEDTRDGASSPWASGWKTPPAPPDGKWVVHAIFSEPGTYVLRCLTHDGGLGASEDITFVVSR